MTETNDSDSLLQEVQALKAEVTRLNNQKFFRIYKSKWRTIGFQLMRGLAFGLGTVLGASILASVLVFALSQIDFIPIFGEWAKEIADEIQGRPSE
ncbi:MULTISPECIES: DUF5665 domain-containing protein [Halocynthiibacter]|uniref:DUF5665 domain-containing protein n=1 Tax=Halocynthiibacter halioticoli TaxID=2986804 RepID=A0AAE3J0Y2_9RHOB|nr:MULTISPECIES: DUF5665 domain-containing protein [Halocynthiibacter]MCV6825730.1 DUF5665 domain-containing protein [Halocynthiibacter halioticoli]MCW4058731.1 DUF5665 domain-containing protein [Halocynthiibacter sp. SDUM655004]MDE0591104.1 DUF5665 domain-containing protein [Halocynthiibacter sp. C4]